MAGHDPAGTQGAEIPLARLQTASCSHRIALATLTFQTRHSAVARSAAYWAKPGSITIRPRVSTLMLEASTALLLARRRFTSAVMTLSSTSAPTISWSRVTTRTDLASKVDAKKAALCTALRVCMPDFIWSHCARPRIGKVVRSH
jgi:hypothetical protein